MIKKGTRVGSVLHASPPAPLPSRGRVHASGCTAVVATFLWRTQRLLFFCKSVSSSPTSLLPFLLLRPLLVLCMSGVSLPFLRLLLAVF